ncbi:MAG: 3-dehydroquinate synthase II [Chloroflexota bacterium]|nr:3-dehydroquinate synthase II [Chloroflexota bacterium]
MISETQTIGLEIAEITELKPVGMGDRVCVDTCTTYFSFQYCFLESKLFIFYPRLFIQYYNSILVERYYLILNPNAGQM